MANPPVVQQPVNTVYVSYFDAITEAKTKAFMAICSDIVAKSKPHTIYFLFSSGGGQVGAGVTLYNFLKALPVEIVMHNVGTIDSVANVIFLAGSKRYAVKHSSFLFHGITWNFAAGASLSFTQFKENLSVFKREEDRMIAILSERTSMTEAEIRELFHQGESKDLQFAITKGIIHEIKDAAVPNNAPLVTVNLN